MKFLVFLFCLCSASYSMAAFDCLQGSTCNSTILVNAGHSGNQCNNASSNCTCSGLSGGCPFTYWTLSCNTTQGYVTKGYTANGYACCVNTRACLLGQNQQPNNVDVESSAPNDDSVQKTFDPQPRSGQYWGVVDSVSKSPDAGRGNSAWAHLDACLGYAKVNTYVNMGSTNDNTQCRTDCTNPANNGVCTDTLTENGTSQADARCKDRCDCWMNATYGKAYNCENL